MESAWQDFGQKVDLTARLREILINYPEGTSILKELVQNADDAKATTVKFCLDYNTYAAGTILSPQMAQFQGPALLAYNDGVFNEKDFESISRIGDSKKREQIGKTGRFGVGFNAIYHLTDVPSFVSGEHLVVFDPHCKHLPAISTANPGKKINFVTHDLNNSLKDQAAPYQLFGCDAKQYFAGTLFRFPLRTQEQADSSTISKQIYTTDKIAGLLRDLQQEATLVLLFLKCTQSIEVLQLLPGHKQPELLFSCSVANVSPGLLLQRQLFLHASAAPADEVVAGTYKLDLICRDTAAQSESSSSFLLCQRRGPQQLLAMATELSKQFQVPLVAWGAVAADITPTDSNTVSDSSPTVGRTFCFLPLPASTSLPVHINGYFELSSNRRDVWHGSDMAGAGRLRAQWNEALLQLVVAPAYLDLLTAAAKMLGHGTAYNRLWPCHDAVDPWQGVVKQLYGHISGKPLLWSTANGGKWLNISQCLFPDDACLEQQHKTADGSAIAQDGNSKDDAESAGTSAVGALGPLGEALLLLDLPLVDMPVDVLNMMQKHLPELPQYCTPAAARAAAATHPQQLDTLQRQEQLVPLLSYCMADLDVAAGSADCQQLLGLKLLPLQDGSLATWQRLLPSGSQRRQQLVFVATEELEAVLVASHRSLLLDHQMLGPAITTKLSLMASCNTLNIQHLSVQHLVQSFLPQLMPSDWRGKAVVHWGDGNDCAIEAAKSVEKGSADGAAAARVTWEWLQALWQWLAAHRTDLHFLQSSGWPLLPIQGNKLAQLSPLTASAVVAPGSENWPDGLTDVLHKLGVHVLDTAGFELPVDVLLQLCVHKPSGPGVAAAVCCALGWQTGTDNQQQSQQAGLQLGLEEARLLRGFLLQPHWFTGHANDGNRQQQSQLPQLLLAAQKLPLYELAKPSRLRHQQLQEVDCTESDSSMITVPIEPGCCLAPAGVYCAALDSRFLLATSDQQATVMVKHLGVLNPTAAQVYREVLLPQLEQMAEDVRDAAMLRMLQALPELQQQDRNFAKLLMQTSFVPNASGKLHTPSQLYDPRVPELVALLDPDTCFPGPALCTDHLEPIRDQSEAAQSSEGSEGTAGGFSGLSALQQLGLRSTADLGTLVKAAKFVERTAKEGDEDMAVARGKALLSYLDSEAERLVGRHTAITSAAAAAIAAATQAPTSTTSTTSSSSSNAQPGKQRQKQQRPGQGLFAAMQSFWGLSGKQQQQRQSAQSSISSHPPQETSDDDSDDDLQQQQQAAAARTIAGHWAELCRTSWCPILAVSPDSVLPWKVRIGASSRDARNETEGQNSTDKSSSSGSRGQSLAAPCAARPRSDLWLVSAVMNVVDGDCRSSVLLSGLEWNSQLPGAMLATQLSALGAANRHVADAVLAQKLARIVPVLYGALAGLPAAELAAAAAVLEGQSTVWVGNGFVPAERVAFKGGLDLSPHLYVLPLELSPFRELLAALGAQEAFSARQYMTLLQDLAQEAGDNPLPPGQLSQALAVAQALADVIGASGGGATAGNQVMLDTATAVSASKRPDEVLVPDSEGVLRPAAELAYDDAPWLDVPTAGLNNELQLVHPRLSAPVAEALGVASRRRLMLAASANFLTVGLAGAGGGIEAFGQSEALTTRLRHIIQDYPEGPGVLLELVQNADDAGAHKAAFLLDARQYGTSSLLGPGMAAWQGPALLAYNDATFSPGDIAAIARIGQDGKMAQPAAIGRFGLGFNAVYHLTDLPSFVSGQHLVLFDPHAKYLPGASAAQPGLRINLTRGQLMRQFPDAFAPYMHFGCTMEGTFPGTLFRFPLRNSTTAATSDIKSSSTSAEQALQLLQSLAEVLPQALLFLKSLKQIEVYVAGDPGALDGAVSDGDQQAQSPRLLFRATLASLDGSGPLQQPITHFVSSGGGGSGSQQLDAFYRRLAATKEADLPCSIGRVQLTLSVPQGLDVDPAQKSVSIQQPGLISPGPDVAHDVNLQLASLSQVEGLHSQREGLQEVVREDWLVCNLLGGGSARALALKAWKDEKVKMIPWVGVAARISNSSTDSNRSQSSRPTSMATSLSCDTPSAGCTFCFLPLPASTSLPVHINGYFELSSNRRDVWHGSDMAGAGRLRAQWNEALLESAVAAAYLALLSEAAQLLGPTQQYWQLFPRGQGSIPEPWLKVSAALYQRLARQAVLWSPVSGGSWLTAQQVLLPDAHCRTPSAADALSPINPTKAQLNSTDSETAADTGATNGIDQLAVQSDAPAAAALGGEGTGGASDLAELLVSCGVPLLLALSDEQQKCLLQWTPGIQQITPALARKLLASNKRQLAATIIRQQQQQQQQPAAAVLLQYCLSDLKSSSDHATSSSSNSSTSESSNGQQQQPSLGASEILGVVRQLHGLLLLPMVNGTVKPLRVNQLSRSSSAAAAAAAATRDTPTTVYVCSDSLEQQLLAALPNQVLHPAAGPVLLQQLLQIAAAGVTNIAQVSASSLDTLLLPLLLPAAWRGQLEVDWEARSSSSSGSGIQEATLAAEITPAATAEVANHHHQQPSREFIRLLWRWLSDRSDASDLCDWPVLPVAGGKLRLLRQPAQVLRGGDWTEPLTSALLKLGCCLLDPQIIDFPCPALGPFVQQPTAAGVLDALIAAQAAAAAAGARIAAQQGSSRRSSDGVASDRPGAKGSSSAQPMGEWQQQLRDLTPAERNQLRAYLLQAKWFAADSGQRLSPQQLHMLLSLPIYEVHATLQYEPTTTGAAHTSLQQQQQQQHVPLVHIGRPPLLLAPDGVHRKLLGSRFISSRSDTEDEILFKHLGIQKLPMSHFLAQHMARSAAEQLDMGALIGTLVHVLRNLRQITTEGDPPLLSVIRDLPLIPTHAAFSKTQHQLESAPHFAAPKNLFDPRNSAFVELLDPLTHFPAPPFDGSSSSSGVDDQGDADAADGRLLEGLVLCGLRTELDLQVLVLAAERIAQYPSDDPTPHHRAHALLRHLNTWAEQHTQPNDEETALWRQLQGIPWCPVVTTPPNNNLPWPHAVPGGSQSSVGSTNATVRDNAAAGGVEKVSAGAVAAPAAAGGAGAGIGKEHGKHSVLRVAPKLVAPADMAWLVSAPLRLLEAETTLPKAARAAAETIAAAAAGGGGSGAGEGRFPGPALQQCLGWTQQQVLRPSVCIAQLIELGKRYPAGQVHDPDLCAQLAAAASTLYASLADHLQDPEQLQLLDMTLSVMPSVWTGSGFAYPAVTALKPPAAAAAAAIPAGHDPDRPHDPAEQQQQQQQLFDSVLWVVPATLQQHSDAVQTLRAIGVPPRHDFAAYAIALAVIAELAAGQPLTERQLSIALELSEAAGHALLSGSGSTRQLQQPGVLAAAAALQAAAAAAAGSSSVAAAGGADILQLPDSDGVMSAASDLYYNDATWLESGGLRLAHAGLPQMTAEALGVRSMRYQHEVTEQLTTNIPCPTLNEAAAAAALVISASSISSKPTKTTTTTSSSSSSTTATLQPDQRSEAQIGSLTGPAATAAAGPVLMVLLSLLAWADGLSCGNDEADQRNVECMSVVLDERQHGTQSLLHPGLAKMQGPSLCIAFRGVSTSPAQLGKYIAAKRPGLLDGSAAAAAAGSDAAHPATAVQLGLSSVWAVTDVLQALSGDNTSYWDPAGAALAQSAAELRTPAPRGRSVRHTEPGLTERFAHQWDVWNACSIPTSTASSTTAASAAASGAGEGIDSEGLAGAAVVQDLSSADTLYLRLPLRLQDSSSMHGSAIVAGLRGLTSGAAAGGLSLEDVRKQVAAFCPSSGQSLLFLGHVHRVSVTHWASGPDGTAARIWQASVVPSVTGNMPLRTGAVCEQQLEWQIHKERNLQGPGGVFARMARGHHSSRRDNKKCWAMQLKTVCRPGVIAELAGVRQEAAVAAAAATDHPAAAAAAGGESAQDGGTEHDQQQQQLQHSRSSSSESFKQGMADSNSQSPQQKTEERAADARGSSSSSSTSSSWDLVVSEEYAWMIAAICEILPPSPISGEALVAAVAGLASASSIRGQPAWVTAAVAVCLKQGNKNGVVVPAAGLFSTVALPAAAAASHLGQQQFLISLQGSENLYPMSTHVYASAPQTNHNSTMAALLAKMAESSSAAARPTGGLSQAFSLDSARAAAAEQQMLSRIADAWHELVVMLSSMGVGMGGGVYDIMPDLVAAAAAGDEDAAAVFRKMYLTVFGMPIWQLHNGRMVFLQEGAFLAPSHQTKPQPQQQQQQQQQGSVGLGEDARRFITKHLPLFNVPWSLVKQLEAAGIPGLRLVSPSVLRPLLARLGDVGGARSVAAHHPFASLSPLQALQLLEFCCSDLTSPARTSSDGQNAAASSSSSSAAARPAAAAAAAAQPSAAAGDLPPNLPEGAATAVGEVFGPQGLAALRGIATQLSTQVVHTVDGVLNAVMDAMSNPQQQQQAAAQSEDVQTAAAAAAGLPAAAAGVDGVLPELNMSKVKWLRGLPIPTADGTIAILGASKLLVYPETCQPPPQTLMPSHLQHQFVSAESITALSWAFKHADLRKELNLGYYGLQRLARHLQEALGSTWELSQPAAVPPTSSRSYNPMKAAAPLSVEAAAVPWDDGAAGGPLLDWLQRLWLVMLHVIAAAETWQQDSAQTTAAAATASSSRVAGGFDHLRAAAERARNMGRGFAEVLAAEFAAGGSQRPPVRGTDRAEQDRRAFAAAAAEGPSSSRLVWESLSDWPLLPLADGRLLRIKHRGLVLAVLPEYRRQQQQEEEVVETSRQDVPDVEQRGIAEAASWATDLIEPWNWLLPAAIKAGVPVLDPRFNHIILQDTAGAAAAAAPSAAAVAPSTAGAAPLTAAAAAPVLPIQDLLGPQPVVGRPPFLGPLVFKFMGAKFLAAKQAISYFRDRQAGDTGVSPHLLSNPWDESTWSKLFDLLADHPPRDLQGEQVTFLRGLPMYRRLQQQQQNVGDVAAEPVLAESMEPAPSSAEATAAAATESASATSEVSRLTALGDDTSWVLAPQAIVYECAGLLALSSLPPNATSHILQHQPQWGELYSILGLAPATLGNFLSTLLLPHLLQLHASDRLASLKFLQQHWASGRWQLNQEQAFVAALGQLAFVPAQRSPAAAAGAAAAARAANSSGDGSHEVHEQLYLARQLFDPTVPLFAKVMATLGDSSSGSSSSSSDGGGRTDGSVAANSRSAAHTPSSSSSSAVARGARVTPDEGGGLSTVVLFPEAPFDSPGWLQVLRALGLQCRVTSATFMQLAQHIATHAANLAAASAADATNTANNAYIDVSKSDSNAVGPLIAAADALLSHLKGQWTGFGPDKALWNALGKVKFVPATLGLPGGRSSRPVFTSCTNVSLHKDWPLVWSVTPLLSDGRALPGLLAQQLGIKSPPPLAAVMQHLKTVGADGGEDLLSTWPDAVGSVTDATSAVLDHLDREGLSPGQAIELAEAPFIPVTHSSRLVPPVQLFVRLGGAALAPFAWEVPGMFVGKLQLLKLLGVKDEPRAVDLVQALLRFERALAGRRMNPNELAACLRLLAYLCSRSSAADASYLAAARRSGCALLAPTAGGQLLPASRVVAVGNSGGGVTAARLLGRADPQHLTLAHPQLSDHICRWLGVSHLSDVLTEQLDPSLSLTALPAINNTSLQQLQQLFASPDFAASVFSIANAHAAAVPDLRQISLGSVSRVCGSAASGKLVFVERLASQVVLKSSGKDVTRDDASRQVYEFNDSTNGMMYVAAPPPGISLSSLLAQVLSRALGSSLTLPLHPLLEVSSPEQLKLLQPVLLPGGYDVELESALASGQVGSPVQAADRTLLRLRPLRHYSAGELIAVKQRVATASSSSDTNTASGLSTHSAAAMRPATALSGDASHDPDGGDGGQQLCYARVAIDAAPAPGQAAYRLSVEVQPRVYETMLSTKVFCFQSGASGPAAGAISTPAPATPAAPDAAVSSTSDAAGVLQRSSSTGGQQMSASEVASAVSDMLSAAGLPLDLDRQALLQRALASDQQLNSATAALAELRQEVTKKETEVEAIRSSWQCRVCFSRDVNQAFVGCGHMYCSACMPSLAKCPVCRKASGKIKLFR